MSEFVPDDYSQRQQALTPGQSFIVQAPAGSGKTGLLIQRLLRLLTTVSKPEEIVAITFTRKAAAEMRERILSALKHAAEQAISDSANDHQQLTYDLAAEVLEHDKRLGWNLAANPGRLRIQTIDAFCASLSRQMPVLSRFGAVPSLLQDASELYQKAARLTVEEMESGESWSIAIEHLVGHFDNRLDHLQKLIVSMLERRDQWIRHVVNLSEPDVARQSLEAAYRRLYHEYINRLSALLTNGQVASIDEILVHQREYAHSTNFYDRVSDYSGTASLFSPDDSIRLWKAIAEILTTNEGNWRLRLTKNEGFPAASSVKDKAQKSYLSAIKEKCQGLISELSASEEIANAVTEIRSLPACNFSADEWETLQALFQILKLSVAQLNVLFCEHGQVDFSAMAQSAIQALGEDDMPTDLALSLDYRMQHILVDEFQDTSWNQFVLLKKLTASWQQGDGRTLFLVGDPMQSIYRFREADVGLFLEVWNNGLGDITLEPLTLTVNFRSQAGIIEWINKAFDSIFPKRPSISDGAVPFKASVSVHSKLPGEAVGIVPICNGSDQQEAEQVIDIINMSRRDNPDATIAILVRSRRHLLETIPLLKKSGHLFKAVEIESLSKRQVILDIASLSYALSNLSDRIAWLSLLRAPWCGLSLGDLHLLCRSTQGPLHAALSDSQARTLLSPEGRAILQRVMPILDGALEQKDKLPLRRWIEKTWLELGGPACLRDENDAEDVALFFSILDELDDRSLLSVSDTLDKRISKLYALPDSGATGNLQIMTLHKSKGLEFDVVVIPGLSRASTSDSSDLLAWEERTMDNGDNDLLIAPIHKLGSKNQRYDYLKSLARRKRDLENSRLLYVATTRARQYLHLVSSIDASVNEDNEIIVKPPKSNTLLSNLWPAVSDVVHEKIINIAIHDREDHPPAKNDFINRLPVSWKHPLPCSTHDRQLNHNVELAVGKDEPVEFSWAGRHARIIGTTIHRILLELSAKTESEPGLNWLKDLDHAINRILTLNGIPYSELQSAHNKVYAALKNTVQSEKGRWLLSTQHRDVMNEFPLTGYLGGKIQHFIIDRTFIDNTDTRWIIDYKTGSHEGGQVDEFLDREQERYQQQLDDYARLFSIQDTRPIRLGLYFPMLDGWREWLYVSHDH